MSDTAAAQWIEPYKGLQWKQRTMSVEADEQKRLLELSG